MLVVTLKLRVFSEKFTGKQLQINKGSTHIDNKGTGPGFFKKYVENGVVTCALC